MNEMGARKFSMPESSRTNWVITLPMTSEWSAYERELQSVSDWSGVLNFRVPFRVSAMRGDRCFVVWRGAVRGWMEVVGVVHHPHGFICQTTGAFWEPGYYIQRSGPWHPVFLKDPGLGSCVMPMRGFRGIRRFQHAEKLSSVLNGVTQEAA